MQRRSSSTASRAPSTATHARLAWALTVPHPAQHGRWRPVHRHIGRTAAGAVLDGKPARAGLHPPRRTIGPHRVRPARRACQDAGEVLAPLGDAVGHEHPEQFVDAIDGQVGRDRRDRLPGAELGVDTVDDRLLRHPPDPEPDGLVRRVPGTGRVFRRAGRELGAQPGVGPVEQRERLLAGEFLGWPRIGLGALLHGQGLVQVYLADVAGQIGNRPAGTGRHRRGEAGGRDGPQAGEVGRQAVQEPGVLHAAQSSTCPGQSARPGSRVTGQPRGEVRPS